jgi:hypothetical protein
MARGAEGKLRRRTQRKNAAEDEPIDMFGTEGNDDTAFPTPQTAKAAGTRRSTVVVEDVDSDEEDENFDENLPKQKKKHGASSQQQSRVVPKKKEGIKTLPLILLVLMVGTTLLPALIFVGDYAATFLSKNNLAGSIGFYLGIGSVPKKRVLSFYEKHAPEKINDVPSILSKHYGNYPQLLKKLERKYQDYGYFMGWQEDEAPLKIGTEYLQSLYDVWIQQYWNRYSPQVLKTAFRNIRYNLTFLYKKGRKIWKKHAWPLLEPIFGVPDGAAEQKRKDAAEARKRKSQSKPSSGSARRKNTDYRDDEE